MNLLSQLVIIFLAAVYCEAFFLRDNIPSNKRTIFEQWLAIQNPPAVIIVGATNFQLRETNALPILIPRLVIKNAKNITTSKEFASETLILQYVSNLEKNYVTEIVEDLRKSKFTRAIFVYEGSVISQRDMEFLLRLAFRRSSKAPVLLNYHHTYVKFYGYGVMNNCSKNVTLIMDWVPGVTMDKLVNWYYDYKRESCPSIVVARNSTAWINVVRGTDGNRYSISGSMGELLATIAEKLNFTSKMKIFPLSEEVFNSSQMLDSCAADNVTIGICHIRPTRNILESFDVLYDNELECIVWCVPKITRLGFNVVTTEFSLSTWLFVALMLLTSFAVEKFVRNIHYSDKGIASKSSDSASIFLDILGLTLGNPIIYKPVSIVGKILLLIYLSYSMVLTTAYKTSLASLFTATDEESLIVEPKDIIEANLTVAGHFGKLSVLLDQEGENKLVVELIKRFQVSSKTIELLHRVSRDKDLAYLTSRSMLNYQTKVLTEAGISLSYEVLDGCVLTFNPVILFPWKSRYTRPIRKISRRLIEGGFTVYWRRKYFPEQSTKSTHLSETIKAKANFIALDCGKYCFVFGVYGVTMVFCILIFFGEIIVHKFNRRKR